MTTFTNASHFSYFGTGTNLGDAERLHMSDQVLAALVQVGFLSGKVTISATPPVDLTLIWLDASTQPGIPKYHNGTTWVAATYSDIFEDGDFVSKAGDTMTGALLMADGTLAAPILSFSGDTDTGIIRTASGTIAIVADGVQVAEFSPTGLTIDGTTTTVDTANLAITDNVVLLNQGEAGAAVTGGTAGLEVDRGTSTNASLIWDDSDDTWKAGLTGSEVALISAFNSVGSGSTLIKQITANSLEVKSLIAQQGVKVTANTDDNTIEMDIDGLTAETGMDVAADMFAFYDASAGAHRKGTVDNMLDAKVIALGAIV